MSDYIKREDALDACYEETSSKWSTKEETEEGKIIAGVIRSIPSADVVKVVRCKDCKNAHMTFDGLCKYCNVWTDSEGRLVELYHSGNNYCSYGVRKDGDGDE